MEKDEKELDMLAMELVAYNEQLTSLQEQINECKSNFERLLNDKNIDFYDKNGLKVRKSCDSSRDYFDSKRFKEEYPNMYKSYLKISKVKGGYRYWYKD